MKWLKVVIGGIKWQISGDDDLPAVIFPEHESGDFYVYR